MKTSVSNRVFNEDFRSGIFALLGGSWGEERRRRNDRFHEPGLILMRINNTQIVFRETLNVTSEILKINDNYKINGKMEIPIKLAR